jgi:hypothetical protein
MQESSASPVLLFNRPRRRVLFSLLGIMLVVVASASGCGKNRPLAPITGKVTYRGKPLTFGTVVFQPPSGQPATGAIQPDGTFQLTTRGEGEGAVVGKNRVRIACYEGQNPNSKASAAGREIMLGKPLIPRKYLSYDTSEIILEVRPGVNEPFILNLTDN